MSIAALKPQISAPTIQKDVLNPKSASSKEARASFGEVLKKNENPAQSDVSAKSKNTLEKHAESRPSVEKPVTRNAAVKADTGSDQIESGPRTPEAEIQPSQVVEAAVSPATVPPEQVLSLFLSKMQEELGVAPEEFVEAFASLSPSDLQLPPEETIEKVIGQLNLTDKQAVKAEALYSEMLALSAAATMSQYLKDQSQTASVEVLNPQQLAKRQLNQGLEDMNSKFFVDNKQKSEALAVSTNVKKAMGQSAYAPKEAPSFMAQEPLKANPLSTSSSTGKIDLSSFDLSEQPLDTETEQIVKDLQNKIEEMSVQAPSATEIAEIAPEALEGSGYIAKEMSVSMSGSAAGPVANESGNLFGGLTAAASVNESSQAGADDFENSEGNQSQDSNVFNLSANDPKAKAAQQQFTVGAPKMTGADVQNNIQEVISQAQFLARKGGGEMNVQMSPEGMGDLKLKVAVKDGQVSVEMLASNDDAKRMLEKGMSDLKASLAGHKLSVENIRVDASQEASNQMNQQQDSAERQFQQRFLHDFKDNNSGFRRGFFDTGMASVPGSQLRDEASNTSYDPLARKKSSARRLDVVA